MCFSHVLTVLSLFTYLCCFATDVTLALANTVEPCLTDTPEKRPSMILLTLCFGHEHIYICLCTIKTLEIKSRSPRIPGSPIPAVFGLYKILVDLKAGPYNY